MPKILTEAEKLERAKAKEKLELERNERRKQRRERDEKIENERQDKREIKRIVRDAKLLEAKEIQQIKRKEKEIRKKELQEWKSAEQRDKFCIRSKTWARIEEIKINLHRNRNLSTFQCPACERVLYLNHYVNLDDPTDTWIPKHKKSTEKIEN